MEGILSKELLREMEEGVWNEEYVSPEVEEMYNYSESMMIPQSPLQLQHLFFDDMIIPQNTLKETSAFKSYKEFIPNGFKLKKNSSTKQKSTKRCIELLRRIHENEKRERSRREENVFMEEESYASTHRIAERNRRTKLRHNFLALQNLLPHNSKKCDKHSTLSSAIVELNRQKLRIAELEQQNKMFMNEITQHVCEGYSSFSYGNVEDIGKHPLMASICEEAVVVVEESHEIGDEKAILRVTLRNVISNSKYMDAIVTLVKCLGEMKLGVGRIECREVESLSPVIEVLIQ